MTTIVDHLTRFDKGHVLIINKKQEYGVKSYIAKKGLWDVVRYKGTTNIKDGKCVFVIDLFLCPPKAVAALASMGSITTVNSCKIN